MLAYLRVVVGPTKTSTRLDTHPTSEEGPRTTDPRIRAEAALLLSFDSGFARLGPDLSCCLRALPTGQLRGHSESPRELLESQHRRARPQWTLSPSSRPPIECPGQEDAMCDWPTSADVTRCRHHATRACVAVQKNKPPPLPFPARKLGTLLCGPFPPWAYLYTYR